MALIGSQALVGCGLVMLGTTLARLPYFANGGSDEEGALRQSTANRLRCAVDSATLWIYACSLAAAVLGSDGATGTLSHTSTRLLLASGADMFRSCADGSADSDGDAAASTAMLTVMPIVVVPCLVGGYWLPRCAGQCSRGKVAPSQTVVDSDDGGGAKTRGSYWTKASRAGQSYYYRWQTPGLEAKSRRWWCRKRLCCGQRSRLL